MKTSAYIQITGLLDQTAIGLESGDPGAELDPEGPDGFGNPIGGLVYSNSLPTTDGPTPLQSLVWNKCAFLNQAPSVPVDLR